MFKNPCSNLLFIHYGSWNYPKNHCRLLISRNHFISRVIQWKKEKHPRPHTFGAQCILYIYHHTSASTSANVEWNRQGPFGKKPSHGQHLLSSGEVNHCQGVTAPGQTYLREFTLFCLLPKEIANDMTSNSNLSNMRRLVEQLKLEASVERIKVRGNKKNRCKIIPLQRY